MRKSIVFVLMLGTLAYLCPIKLSAEHKQNNPAKRYLSFSLLPPFGLGYKHHLARNFYIVTDLDYTLIIGRKETGI